MTLADSVVELIKKRSEAKNPRIEKQDLRTLSDAAEKLKAKLNSSADLAQLIFVLRESESACSQVDGLKDLSRWLENYSPGDDKWSPEVKGAIWNFTRQSIDELEVTNSNLRDGPITEVPSVYRAKYQIFTLEAESNLEAAKRETTYREVARDMTEVHRLYAALVSQVVDDVKAKTETLVG